MSAALGVLLGDYFGDTTGYTLSFSDDFIGSLDIVGPATPAGKYFPSRPYGFQTASAPSLGIRYIANDVAYQTDPLHTGLLDSNRGVAVGFDTIRQSSSVLTLQARLATSGEQATFFNTAKGVSSNPNALNASCILHTAGAFGFYPGTSAKIKIAFLARALPISSVPRGWNTSVWMVSHNPVVIHTGLASEWDIIERFNNAWQFAENEWSSGADTGGSTNPLNLATFTDNAFHLHELEIVKGGPVIKYLDGVVEYNKAIDGNIANRPYFLLMTSFVDGGSIVQADWNTSGTTSTSGARLEIDYLRIYRQNGLPHYSPLQSVSDLSLPYAGKGTIVLPSKADLWGDSTVTEYVQCIPTEENEPGTTPTASYEQFPSFVTYNSGTRTITVDFSAGTGGAGRLHFVVSAYQTTGCTFVPLRFAVNRAPVITQTAPSGTHGVAYSHDFYFDCDVGILTPKVIAISGLPSGLTFDGVSTVSGTPAAAGNTNVSISCTNNMGQTTSTTFMLTIT